MMFQPSLTLPLPPTPGLLYTSPAFVLPAVPVPLEESVFQTPEMLDRGTIKVFWVRAGHLMKTIEEIRVPEDDGHGMYTIRTRPVPLFHADVDASCYQPRRGVTLPHDIRERLTALVTEYYSVPEGKVEMLGYKPGTMTFSQDHKKVEGISLDGMVIEEPGIGGRRVLDTYATVASNFLNRNLNVIQDKRDQERFLRAVGRDVDARIAALLEQQAPDAGAKAKLDPVNYDPAIHGVNLPEAVVTLVYEDEARAASSDGLPKLDADDSSDDD